MSNTEEIEILYEGVEKTLPESMELLQQIFDDLFPHGASILIVKEDETLFTADIQYSYGALIARDRDKVHITTPESDLYMIFEIEKLWRLPPNDAGVRCLVMKVKAAEPTDFVCVVLTTNVGTDSAKYSQAVKKWWNIY